ncbi:hypothetical protein ES708_23585 [subsurface metagenome]
MVLCNRFERAAPSPGSQSFQIPETIRQLFPGRCEGENQFRGGVLLFFAQKIPERNHLGDENELGVFRCRRKNEIAASILTL